MESKERRKQERLGGCGAAVNYFGYIFSGGKAVPRYDNRGLVVKGWVIYVGLLSLSYHVTGHGVYGTVVVVEGKATLLALDTDRTPQEATTSYSTVQ